MDHLTIKVPDVGEGIAEVELVAWSVAVGETVTRNQMVAEVMTDKASVEVPAPIDGVIGELTGGVGDVLLVGSPLFTLQVEGATDEIPEAPDLPEPLKQAEPSSPTAPAARPSVAETRAPVGPINAAAPRVEGRRPIASPAVRRRARDGGIDLRTVTGTGPAGRITHDDIDTLFSASSSRGHSVAPQIGLAALRPSTGHVTDQPIVGMRRKIAQQMVSSMSTIPHITYVEQVDMTSLEELRATLNGNRGSEQSKLTVLPFLVRALVNHLREFPQMNAHVLDADEADGDASTSTLRLFDDVHVGIATQTDAGLVVPVLRNAQTKTVWSTADGIGQLAEAARTGTAGREDLTGSTITISSLGSLGGLVTTPVINKPETTIIGVNKMVTAPVWIDGAFVPRKVMNLSCSFDHRVIDGWDAARFVQAIKGSLEQPALLFMERP